MGVTEDSVLLACGTPYDCCVDGRVETCHCPPRDYCMQQKFLDHGDGTCSAGVEAAETGDTAGD